MEEKQGLQKLDGRPELLAEEESTPPRTRWY